MTTDVTLLADGFEGFRESSLKHYKLDPAHFLTALSLGWSACLKNTKVKLELPNNIDMSILVDDWLIGGISLIANQYSKTKPAGTKHWDTKKLQSFIFMVDCNSQYGWSMSQFLPTGGFKWKEIDTKRMEFLAEFIKRQKNKQDK